MAKAGYKNLICFSGNRKGMDDETGLKNCEEGLKKILPLLKKMVLSFKWNYSTVKWITKIICATKLHGELNWQTNRLS